MKQRFQQLRLTAIASALPEQTLALSALAPLYGEQEVRRIVRSTGIEAVRLAGALKTGDLCAAAAASLLAATGTDPQSIDALVLVTQTPDMLMPATSVQLQHRLGLARDCLAFDINYGCSGYIYGLYQAAMLIRGGGCRRVLLCTGDVTSKLLHAEDRHVRMVFGDGASATLLEAGEDEIDFLIRSDGGGAGFLNTPLHYANSGAASASVGHLHMDGAAIMNFALSEVPPLIGELLAMAQLRLDDVGMFGLHQANAFMLNYLCKVMGIERQRAPLGVAQVGNTGPSSVPLMLTMRAAQPELSLRRSVLCGFGIGLSWGAARLDLSRTRFIAPVDVKAPAAPAAHPAPAMAMAD